MTKQGECASRVCETMADMLVPEVGRRYEIQAVPSAGVTVGSDRSSAVAHDLPNGTVVVCAEVSTDGQRVRISSPAGWLDTVALGAADPAPVLKLDFETFQQRHALVQPGDTYGLDFPFSLAMLEEFGADFLTRAFHASGVMAADNRVTAILAMKPVEVKGASENALMTIAYAKDDPAISTELFVKMPPADQQRKFGLAGMSHGEVQIAQLSQKGVVPVETAKYYFGDYCTYTANYLLITGKIAFGVDPIEPARHKGYDFMVPDVGEHYQILNQSLAHLVAAHKLGAMGYDIEAHFPYARAARDFWPSPDSAGRLDRLVDFIGRIAPQLFVTAGTERAFLQQWRDDVLFGLAHKDAVIAYLHADPDYTGLCHSNLNIDNAWYWRDEAGKLHVGLLDWGGTGQMSIAQALSSMLMMPEPEVYIALERETIAGFIAEYRAAGGVALDVETLRFHYKASVFSTAIWIIVDYITDVLFQFSEEDYAGMKDRHDQRLTSSGLYSAIIWIDNMLRDWLDDLTPGEACRRIVIDQA